MKPQKFCVYNETSECFLSLGISLDGDALGHLAGLFRRRVQTAEDGQWVLQPKPIHTLAFFGARDLVLLSGEHRVLEVIESWPSFRVVRLRDDAESLLSLPVHTIYSSQTQPGDQLMICMPEEMQSRLRTVPDRVFETRGETSSDVAPVVADHVQE